MKHLQPYRDPYWDTAKAILIFLVILGHTIQYFSEASHFWHHGMFKVIYLFHMPLFTLISGYFALDRMLSKSRCYIIRQAQHLLIPALTVGAIEFVKSLISRLIKAESIASWNILETVITLWFLWVIFECCFIGWLFWRYESRIWRICCATFPMAIAMVFPSYFPYSQYFTFLWPFFMLGFWAKHRGITRVNFAQPACWLCLPFAVTLYLYWLSPYWYVYNSPLCLKVTSFIPAIARLAAGFVFSIFFLCCIHYVSPILAKYNLILQIGRGTLGLYVLQHLFFEGIWNIVPHHQLTTPFYLLLAALITIICYAAYRYLSKKSWLSLFLLGKTNT